MSWIMLGVHPTHMNGSPQGTDWLLHTYWWSLHARGTPWVWTNGWFTFWSCRGTFLKMGCPQNHVWIQTTCRWHTEYLSHEQSSRRRSLVHLKIYNTHNVLDELMSRTGFTWYKPSQRLMSLVSCDLGALQHNHTDLDQMIEDHNMWVYHECVQLRCMDCAEYGFPCHYLAERGFEKPHLAHTWQANF